MNNVFIIGEQRSGSNLLRLMLNNHPDLTAPHPPHIILRFLPLLNHYGSLKNKQNYVQLLTDVVELIRRNPIDWQVQFEVDKLAEKWHDNSSIFTLFFDIMNDYKIQQNKKRWVCKSMQNVRFSKQILAIDSQTKFIYLHRDPRDVVASFKRAVVGEKHAYFIAQKWNELQELSLNLLANLGTQKVHQISYEELTQNPANAIQKICSFLELFYDEKMLEFYTSKAAQKSAQASPLWANLKRPVMANNFHKFEKELSREEIQIIEKISHENMRKLGYETSFSAKEIARFSFEESDISHFDEENKFAKKQAKSTANLEDLERRRYQLEVLEQVLLRV